MPSFCAEPGAIKGGDAIRTCANAYTPSEAAISVVYIQFLGSTSYCMQPTLKVVPKVWFCEACRSNEDTVSPESGTEEHLLKSSRMGVPCEKRRALDTAKINLLPAEEAIMLPSGALTKASPLQGGMGSPTVPSDILHPISRSPVVSPTAPPKSFLKKRNANPSSRASGHSKSLTLGKVLTRSLTPRQQAIQNSKSLKDEKSPVHFPCKRSLPQTNVSSVDAKLHSPLKHIGGTVLKSGIDGESYEGGELGLDKAADTVDSSLRKETPVVPRKEYVCNEDPIDAVMSGKEVDTSNTKMERAVYKPMCGTFCTEAKPNNVAVQERDLPRVLPEFENYLPNPPSINATWKGSFEILNTVTPSKFYDGFKSHPPGVVSRKAYEFSKQMPGVLQFKLQPRCDLWAELFQTDCPDGHDIALYFFPGDFERSKQMYDCLLGLIEMHDSVLRSCCFDGVELLIFSSKHLHADSHRLNMQFYLWGIYRRLKGNEAIYKEHGLFSSSLSYEMGNRSTWGGTCSSDQAAEPPVRDVISQVHTHRPNEGAGAQHLQEVKREQINDPSVPPGFSKNGTSEAACERTLRKSPAMMPTVLRYSDSPQHVLEVKREQFK
ncbi:hypothetical protein HHK36_007347 [Tetracentron sinense]|uniref:AIPP2-like SPOC-like domain-containing protein n=1 Tax=Tetracentron sinense TaxID=13715 RepID=A0A834ZJ40_TETSI|nr:hypothetical protein HHK36_007347 [Tetracentron sinense]